MYRRNLFFAAYVSILLLDGCSGRSIEYLRARASHLVSNPTSQPGVTLFTAMPAATKLATMVRETPLPISGDTKPAQAGIEDEQPVTGKVTVDGGSDVINVRTGPGTMFILVGRLFAGQTVEVTGRSPQGDWWRVKIGKLEGWVYSAYLTVERPWAVPCIGFNNDDCTSYTE